MDQAQALKHLKDQLKEVTTDKAELEEHLVKAASLKMKCYEAIESDDLAKKVNAMLMVSMDAMISDITSGKERLDNMTKANNKINKIIELLENNSMTNLDDLLGGL